MKRTIFLVSVFGVALSASLNSLSLGGRLAIRATPGELPWKSSPAAQGVNDQETSFQRCADSYGLDENLCGTGFYCASFDNLDTLKELPELKNRKFDFASKDECLKAHVQAPPSDTQAQPPQENHQPSESSSPAQPPLVQPTAQPQPEKSNDQRLQEFCGRLEDEKQNKACRSAATRCTGRVQRGASMDEFLNCVDRVQVCADYKAPKHDQCFRYAEACKEEQKLALGELTDLATCARGRTDGNP